MVWRLAPGVMRASDAVAVRTQGEADLCRDLVLFARHGVTMMSAVHGTCDSRFSSVREALQANVDSGEELGASIAVNVDGETIVDLWGGWRDPARTLRCICQTCQASSAPVGDGRPTPAAARRVARGSRAPAFGDRLRTPGGPSPRRSVCALTPHVGSCPITTHSLLGLGCTFDDAMAGSMEPVGWRTRAGFSRSDRMDSVPEMKMHHSPAYALVTETTLR